MRSRARPLGVAASAFLVVFVLGLANPTYADPGSNGQGAERSSAAQDSGTDGGQVAAKGRAVGKVAASERTTGTSHTTKTTGSGWRKSSGDVTVPQPLSNADRNSGGANGQCPDGPYCSTRDGSPSMNGNGNGNAVGKPCAGCVGKADNKNPHGQMPNGSDHNAGYECDRNHGIGRTNPAHTGCKQVTPPKPPKPPVVPPKPPVPHVKPPVPPAEVIPAVVHRPAQRPAAQVAPAAAAQAPTVLPPTGSDPLEAALALSGAGLLLAGAFLIRRRRSA